MRYHRGRRLTAGEKISVRSAARAICKYRQDISYGPYPHDPNTITKNSIYTSALLTGLAFGSDFDADLPTAVNRYLDRYGCTAILDKER